MTHIMEYAKYLIKTNDSRRLMKTLVKRVRMKLFLDNVLYLESTFFIILLSSSQRFGLASCLYFRFPNYIINIAKIYYGEEL